MQEIKSLYQRHFQKSKVFLYPVLGIGRKDLVIPRETYISWKGHYNAEDRMLICLYVKDHIVFITPEGKVEYRLNKLRYEMFANKHLDGNSMFTRRHELDYPNVVYVFRFPDRHDWDMFLKGRYSKFSDKHKKKIRNFFAQSNKHYAYVDSYISPERYYGMYSDILGVSTALLREVVELCEHPNLEEETFDSTVKQKQI